ncbi:MAG TPA: prolyl aminopeptidase [Thermoanaerobaculia bacterium]|nr:prolyl aminopeptidase [Thermoanaerobaculia bacterium]
MRTLFPEREPYKTFRFPVSDLHELHVEEAGTPDGVPVVFFHGGPGAGVSPIHRRFFDPSYWRVVLFDQRGSGKSTPLGELRNNTTWDLVEDAEKIREHLGIESWFVFGGSWGSTLGLAYAESYPERVRGMVLRGIFLSRRTELDWTFVDGARRIFPDGWDDFVAPLSPRERGDVLAAYHRRLTSDDFETRRAAAVSWNLWEERASKLVCEAKRPEEPNEEHEISIARIEAHYFVNGSFFIPGNQLLRDAARIARIPGVIVQGRYDIVCPATSAWELHKVWPASRLELVADAGHAADEPGNIDALVRAMEEFKEAAGPPRRGS